MSGPSAVISAEEDLMQKLLLQFTGCRARSSSAQLLMAF